MDVSRISMVTPKIIDWRRLTAKEIIKYDNEGMNVPQEYLSWARAFRVDLEKNDTDETTYEMAISKPTTPQNTTTQSPEQSPTQTSEQQETTPEQNNNIVEPTPQLYQPAATPQNTQNTPQPTTQTQEATTPVAQVIQPQQPLQQSPATQTTSQTNKQPQPVQPTQTAQTPQPIQTPQTNTTNNQTQTTSQTTTQPSTSTDETQETEINERTETEEEQEEKMTADEKRKKMEAEGEDTATIAKVFREASIEKGDTSNEYSNTITTIGESSDNTISSLDNYISDLMADANNLQSQINSLKNKKDAKGTNLAKIKSLQDELKQLGTTGQNVTLGYDTDLNLYQTTIDEGLIIGLDAEDYGNTTVELGKGIKSIISLVGLGRSVENAGKDAVSAGDGLKNNATMTSDRNNANRNSIQQHQYTIQNLTGISAGEVSGDNRLAEQNGTTTTTSNTGTQKPKTGENATDKTNQKPQTGTDISKTETLMQKAEKEESNATDDKKTEVEKKAEKIASGNLDEILKRKMRKGETV